MSLDGCTVKCHDITVLRSQILVIKNITIFIDNFKPNVAMFAHKILGNVYNELAFDSFSISITWFSQFCPFPPIPPPSPHAGVGAAKRQAAPVPGCYFRFTDTVPIQEEKTILKC